MINLLGFIPQKFYKKKIVKKAETVFYYLTLFVMGVVFLQYSNLDIYAVKPWLLVTVIIESILVGKLYIDIREVLLFVGMGIFYYITEANVVDNLLFLFLTYNLVKLFLLKKGCDYKKRAIQIFSVMALAICVGGAIDFINYVEIPGIRNVYWESMWNDNEIKTSFYFAYTTLAVSALFWCLITIRQHILLSIAYLVVIGSVIYEAIKTESRTIFVVLAIVFICQAIVYFIKNYNNKKMYIMYIGAGILTIVGGFFVYYLFVKNSIDADVLNKDLSRGGGIFHNIRFKISNYVLRELPSHPWGGIDTYEDTGYYAHNAWLYIAQMSGILPFVLVLSNSFINIIGCIKLYKHNLKSKVEYLLVSLLMGIYLYFFVESVNVTMIWGLYCIVSGSIEATIEKNNIKEKDKKRKRRTKKGVPVVAVLTFALMLSGCGKEIDEQNNSSNLLSSNEYIDTAEYDDIELAGSGTKEDPYLIHDFDELRYLSAKVNTGWQFVGKYVLQTDDIDCNGIGINPIGENDYDYSFMGTYDGGGHVVKNIKIYSEFYAALFAKLGGTVMNLGIVGGYIEGWKAAGLVGICTSSDAKILNCFTQTELVGKETAGIVVSASGTVEGCFSASRLTAVENADQIAISTDGKIDRCYTTWGWRPGVNNYYVNNIVIWLDDDDMLDLDTVEQELNEYIYYMASKNAIPSEKFCIWEVNEEGGSIRLTDQRAESGEIYNTLILKDFMINTYPYLPMLIGGIIELFVILSTVRAKKKII